MAYENLLEMCNLDNGNVSNDTLYQMAQDIIEHSNVNENMTVTELMFRIVHETMDIFFEIEE